MEGGRDVMRGGGGVNSTKKSAGISGLEGSKGFNQG